MSTDSDARYAEFYRSRAAAQVFPVEFVVRAFLGNYPDLPRSTAPYAGQRVLDLGFGDGRNMPLLHHLGMQIAGVETTADLCRQTADRMAALGIDIDARAGRNSAIPFEDAAFDTVLACHACYYVDAGETFAQNLNEIARVLKPGGRFVFSAPISTSYILKGAEDLGDHHMRIAADPYGVRVGVVLRAFADAAELERALSPRFQNARIGSARNDWWGIEEHVWIAACHRI
jgi:SAM-dependent methyltransferase